MINRDMSATALALVPLLTLPVLVGALWLALYPESHSAALFIILCSLALAWYLLGGAIAARHFATALAERRELRDLAKAMDAAGLPAFVASSDGLILAQNALVATEYGDLAGRRAQDALGRSLANPAGIWKMIASALDRKGATRVDFGPAGAFAVSRAPGGRLQLWLSEPELRAEPFEPQPERHTDLTHFETLPVAILILDAKATVLRANTLACEMLGEDLDGRALSMMFEGPGRALTDWVADVCSGRLQVGSEVLRMRGDGPERFMQVSLKSGQGDGVTAVLSDVSDLKRLEAQFVQSQKMQAIGQLAGGIAHDFNNLLTAISGHCDLLMLRHDKGDPDFSDLDQISQNANRAASLVGQLLAYSRKQTLKFQRFDLRDALADLTHLLNRLVGEKIILTFQHDPKLNMVRADKRQLEQVIMNLVVNARDAMPNGGDILIATSNLHIDPCSNATGAEGATGRPHHALPAGDYVGVEVVDQGCGIPPDILSKIFEPFFSTKRTGEGTGLGLSTAYGIVKQTGGFIFCDSVVGEGTTFSLYFPAHIRTVSETDGDHAPEPAQPAQTVSRIEREATVLLVEDEAAVRAFASRALKLQGFKVLEAACAEDALELLSDQRLVVDVFVTDVVMPGMDGPAWVRTALRERPSTRVIFMSGYSENIFAEGNPPVPNSVFLAKPFSLSELTALVSKQLEATPEMA
ncbi:ATP-binding protein [Paracoccus cavernae]|uniref:hybrid sensor histidine kinase/response regulator n=1 Tax=Paracoccus cavernae TaxID=1571207 RepID=UPI0035F349D3